VLGGDLKARIAIENLDGANLGLRHIACTTQERQQPSRIRIALTSDIDPEPNHLAAKVPRRALGAAVAPARALVLISRRPILRCPILRCMSAIVTTLEPLPRWSRAIAVAWWRAGILCQVLRCWKLGTVHTDEGEGYLVCRASGLQHLRKLHVVFGRGIGEDGIRARKRSWSRARISSAVGGGAPT
jgi:hypothetical protein